MVYDIHVRLSGLNNSESKEIDFVFESETEQINLSKIEDEISKSLKSGSIVRIAKIKNDAISINDVLVEFNNDDYFIYKIDNFKVEYLRD